MNNSVRLPSQRGLEPDLLQNLLYRATSRRSLHLLAMAFRLRFPRWGSQALLVTQGLAGYLDFIEWDLTQAEYRLMDFFDMAGELARSSASGALQALRITQIRHLAELNDQEQTYTMRPADDTVRCRELTAFANQGLLLADLKAGMQHELDAEEYQRLAPLLSNLSLDDYVAAVHPEDQNMHPNVLHARIADYERRTAQVATLYSPSTGGYRANVGGSASFQA